jgi:hypothetical protein
LKTTLVAFALILCFAGSSLSLDWQEARLQSGGKLVAVDTGEGGWVSVALAFPAGVAYCSEQASLAYLAADIFGDNFLRNSLAEVGWSLEPRVEQDTALILMSGPSEDLGSILEPVLAVFGTRSAFDESDLAHARSSLKDDRDRWRSSPEALLRSRMAKRLYGDHPYGQGVGRFDEEPISTETLVEYLDHRYSPSGIQIVLAGDLDASATLRIWANAFYRLHGPQVSAADWPDPIPGSGRFESEHPSRQNILLMQLPGLPSDDPRAPLLALAGGIIQLLCETDIRDARLARNVSVWYRFAATGPSHLEVALRDVVPDKMERVEAVLTVILQRLRNGDFSQFAVISAKDRILGRLENHSSRGSGPASQGLGALQIWTAETARQGLLMRGVRASFQDSLLVGNVDTISAFASEHLPPEQTVLGILRQE